MLRFLAALALACLAGSAAHADPRVNLGWDTCAGPIQKTVPPGSTVALFASVLGQSGGHAGYDLRIRVTTWCGTDGPISPLPDAWRFDAAGCQGSGRVSIDHLPPIALTDCPAFQGALTSQQIAQYTYDPLLESATVTLINAYAPGVASSNPATHYFLERVLFDQTYGANGPTSPGLSCGRLEVPVCFQLVHASWLDLANNEHDWLADQPCVSANDPQNGGPTSGCFAVTPARAATWGAIKAQYR